MSQYPILGDESIMSKKKHGTSDAPVQKVSSPIVYLLKIDCLLKLHLCNSLLKELRWKCNNETADSVCNFNRHYAEHSGYFLETSFLNENNEGKEITFYDSGMWLFCDMKSLIKLLESLSLLLLKEEHGKSS